MNPKNDRVRFKYLNPEFKQHIIKKLEHINKIERTILTKQMTIQSECSNTFDKTDSNVCNIYRTNLKQLYDKKKLLEKELFNLYFEEED
jgi:hypothetical protein